MLITVINPNTTRAMTDLIGSCARGVAGPGTRIAAVNPPMGPASIESHYDEALSVPGLLHEVAAGERAGSDGYVIACFGDPGLVPLASSRAARSSESRRRRCTPPRWSAAASASSPRSRGRSDAQRIW